MHDPWEERGRRKATTHKFITNTVESHLSDLHIILTCRLSEMHLAKPHPLFLATFVNVELALAIQMVDSERLRACFTCFKTWNNCYKQGRLRNKGKSNSQFQPLLCAL